MNEEMLRNIELLRQRACISYEEAATLLEHNSCDVIRALMVLEQQGRLKQQQTAKTEEPWQEDMQKAKEKAMPFIEKAFKNRMVIEKKQADGSRTTVVNLSTPLVIGAAVLAPWLAVASAAMTVATGCSVKIKNEE